MVEEIRRSWDKKGISHHLNENNSDITLSKIVVPKEKRGKGVGHEAIKELTDYADKNKKRVLLSPDTSFGGTSTKRLKDFYKEHEFIENKGRNRDFTTKESMLRTPKEHELPHWKND